MRLREGTLTLLGSDMANLASQQASAGALSPMVPAGYTNAKGFRDLKTITATSKAYETAKIERGEHILPFNSPHPLVHALARAPVVAWKPNQFPSFVISLITQALSAYTLTNPEFIMPIL